MYLKDITGTLGNELSGKRIALCVTGSISITEAPGIARLLMRHGADVIPVLTPRACEFVSPMIFEWSTGNPPITKLTGKVEHVELVSIQSSKRADLILIAPCTANTIGKISSGISDEPVSTLVCTALGSGIPILIASAMHEPMIKNPIIQQAKEKLEREGVKFIEGSLVESKSKLAEPEEIVQAVISEIGKSKGDTKKESIAKSSLRQETTSDEKRLARLGVIVTAGPTREPIDQVRFITNASTGKMGVALAVEALLKGSKRVCLIHGPGVVVPVSLTQGDGRVRMESVVTTQEMQDSVLSKLSKGGEYNVLISAGAPADYTNLSPVTGKISTSEERTLKLELSATKKIIAVVKEQFPKTFVVAFKAEHGLKNSKELSLKALETLKTSRVDIVVANDVARTDIGFGSDYNEVLVVTKDGKVRNLPKASKNEIAAEILDILAEEIHRST
ncbi:MAG: phosphopantothenoylcysteine decarboxylase [archaeon]|nr:phosphopantothenoylcysteine decarboxylase [archaeon]